jgi:hypothetical protein
MADDCTPDRTGAVSTADTRRCDVCGETSAATLMQDTTPTNYCAAPLSQLNPNAAAATEPPVCGICGEKSIAAYYTATHVTKLCTVHLSLFDRDAAGAMPRSRACRPTDARAIPSERVAGRACALLQDNRAGAKRTAAAESPVPSPFKALRCPHDGD